MAARFWTCRRVSGGEKCLTVNPRRKRLCENCGKPRPVRKKPAHMQALELSYEEYVRINGGEFCGICGVGRSANRRLDRDHDHVTGTPRGLLCHICNRTLGNRVTLEWLENAVSYVRKARAWAKR